MGGLLVAGPLPGSIGEQGRGYRLVEPLIGFGTGGDVLRCRRQARRPSGIEAAERNLLQATQFQVDRVEIVDRRRHADRAVHEAGLTGRLTQPSRFIEHQPFERPVVLGDGGREQGFRGQSRTHCGIRMRKGIAETSLQLGTARGQVAG